MATVEERGTLSPGKRAREETAEEPYGAPFKHARSGEAAGTPVSSLREDAGAEESYTISDDAPPALETSYADGTTLEWVIDCLEEADVESVQGDVLHKDSLKQARGATKRGIQPAGEEEASQLPLRVQFGEEEQSNEDPILWAQAALLDDDSSELLPLSETLEGPDEDEALLDLKKELALGSLTDSLDGNDVGADHRVWDVAAGTPGFGVEPSQGEAGGRDVDIGFLAAASDDQLGIPPSPASSDGHEGAKEPHVSEPGGDGEHDASPGMSSVTVADDLEALNAAGDFGSIWRHQDEASSESLGCEEDFADVDLRRQSDLHENMDQLATYLACTYGEGW